LKKSVDFQHTWRAIKQGLDLHFPTKLTLRGRAIFSSWVPKK
jgi:hypothetical protein